LKLTLKFDPEFSHLRWADIHNHNEEGYGKGSLDRSYAIAKGVGLDAYAFTPHGWWHDFQQADDKTAAQHEGGFERVRKNWEKIRAKADSEYRPGEFASLVAFEWHSSSFGDYHVLMPGSEGEVCRGSSLAELQQYARQTGAVIIPHHLAYRQGWRGINWNTFSSDVSPVVDGFSEHGCSIEPDTHHPMILHSMGGAERSQTVLERYKLGLVAGVLASSDNHWGCPASYGEGLAGIYAAELTREGVLDALRRRHTFAVTGDRLGMQFESTDGMMGDILPLASRRNFRYHIKPCARLDYVELIKNGHRHAIRSFPSEPQADGPIYSARLEFGWGGPADRSVTIWDVEIEIENGEFHEVVPCFAGGGGSVEEIHAVTAFDSRRVCFHAYTARANSRPTGSLVLRYEGNAASRLKVRMCAKWGDRIFNREFSGSNAELISGTICQDLVNEFISPKISLSVQAAGAETLVGGEFCDNEESSPAWYLLKAQQRNGQIAWASPIWFAA